MARLTWRRIAAVAFGLGVVSWAVNLCVARTGSPIVVSWIVSIPLLISAVAALGFGWEVKQYREGNRPGLSPFTAAKTAMFAQASALTGAALAGVYAGYAVALAGDWQYAYRRNLILTALLDVLASALLCAAGWVAERWCAIDGGDDDDYTGGRSAEAV